MDAVVVATLLLLHTPGGQTVHVHPSHITHLRPSLPKGDDKKLFTDEVHCMINLADGKYVTVVETCEAVRNMMEDRK